MLFAEDNIYTLFFDHRVQYFLQNYVFPESRFFCHCCIHKDLMLHLLRNVTLPGFLPPTQKYNTYKVTDLEKVKDIHATCHKACIDFVR